MLRVILGGLLSTFLIVTAVISNTSAAENDPLTKEERAWLTAHPEIRIAPYQAFPPFEFIDNYGKLVGVGPDYLELLEEKIGIRFRVVKTRDWNEAIQFAKDRKVDALPVVARTKERTKYLDFTAPYIEAPVVIVAKRGGKEKMTMEDLKGLDVAVVGNYAVNDYLKEFYPHLKYHSVGDGLRGLRRVSFGTVDVMIVSAALAKYYVEKVKLTKLRVAGEVEFTYKLSFASRNDWPLLRSILAKGFALITPDERTAIKNTWLTPNLSTNFDFKNIFIAFISALSILLIIGVLIWNRSLQKQIELRTGELENAKNAAEAASEAKGMFLANVSHELRTPLTSISGSLSLVSSGVAGEISDEAKEFIDIAAENAEGLGRLIDDILDFERIRSGKMDYKFERIDLADILNKAATANDSYGRQYGVTFQLQNPLPEAIVRADRDRLMQVMANLLSNAAKFSSTGDEVKIELECHDSQARVSVIDHGQGIPEKFLSKIFSDFARDELVESNQIVGTGLGLSISKKIIDYHSGKITFDTEVDKGSTLFFILPIYTTPTA